MDIRKAILQEHSKAQTLRVAAYIGDDAERFAELINLLLHDEYIVVQRASWIVSEVAEHEPQLAAPYLEDLVALLNKETGLHPGVKRNIVRLFQFIDIPENIQGILTDTCFNLLTNPQEPIAVKACCITVLTRMVKVEPLLANELRLVIEDQLRIGKASLHARAREAFKVIDNVIM